MTTILLTFDNETERDEYLELMRNMAAYLTAPSSKTIASSDVKTNGELILKVLETVKLDPVLQAESEKKVALFVSGQKMMEGPLNELNKIFYQEIQQHRGSVQLRELRGEDWVIIAQRPSY